MTRSLALLFCWLTAGTLCAAEPAVRNLDVRGLQVGGTTTLVVDGDNLGKTPRLLLPFPAVQKLKPGNTPARASFEVTLTGDIIPGYHHLRLVTEGGVSLPVVIGVDSLLQRPMPAKDVKLPLALHGALTGSTIFKQEFIGKAGQKVMVEVEANRLGSKLRPVVHLYDSKSRQLAWNWPRQTLAGDARLEVTLPADGTYTVTVHDVEYAGPAPGFFRLKIGQWSFVEGVFPPVVGKDRKTVELFGPARPLTVPLSPKLMHGVLPLAWPGKEAWSGPRPYVTISDRPEVEGPAVGKVQSLPAAPVGASGRLLTRFGEDRYRLPVKPETTVRLEVFAERLGSPLDAALVVRNEAGVQLARGTDAPDTLDPVLEYRVPAKVTSIVVGVIDAQGRAGPRAIYRLTADTKNDPAKQGRFRLLTPAQRLILPVGGRAVIPVWVERRGYRGKIDLSAEGLPPGTKLDGATIPADADGALVTVQRGEGAVEPAITHWRGRAEDGQEQAVVVKGSPLARIQPWLAKELAVAPAITKAADFQIDWRELPADTGFVPSRKLNLPVRLTRPADKSVVRLTLLTGQLPPQLPNNQPDQAKTIRAERPVELAATAKEGSLSVLVPVELPAPSYDVTVQAELLTPDKRTVLATAHTPVRRLAVRMPLVVRLDGPARVEVKTNPKTGATLKLKGQVERREGLTGDVLLTLTGLPAGARANNVTVKSGATEFALDVVLPPTIPAGELRGLTLTGTAPFDPKQPAVRVRSRAVDLVLVVQPAGK